MEPASCACACVCVSAGETLRPVTGSLAHLFIYKTGPSELANGAQQKGPRRSRKRRGRRMTSRLIMIKRFSLRDKRLLLSSPSFRRTLLLRLLCLFSPLPGPARSEPCPLESHVTGAAYYERLSKLGLLPANKSQSLAELELASECVCSCAPTCRRIAADRRPSTRQGARVK